MDNKSLTSWCAILTVLLLYIYFSRPEPEKPKTFRHIVFLLTPSSQEELNDLFKDGWKLKLAIATANSEISQRGPFTYVFLEREKE